jgi:hypothetical protein
VYSLVVPTKSTTLTLTDVGSPKNLSKWNRTPKGSSNFDDVRVHLFVDTLVAIVYIVLSSSTKSTTLTSTDVGSLKIFQNGTERRKARQIFGNVRVYLFISTLATVMYIVLSSSTKSTTLASTDVGSLKNFQNGTERRKARQILVVRESIFSLVRL